jgi:transcriptional pleiotropic regulator of transition state genes
MAQSMKAIGMARKIDELGRVVLPAELRRLFDIHEGDYLEIHVEENRIILSKVEDRCVFCSEAEGLQPYRDKLVCETCVTSLSGH